MACAGRLLTTPRTHPELHEALGVGWSVALGGPGDCDALRSAVEGRDDLDDDGVAAVAFALVAVVGNPVAAWRTASRALDAAFDRIAYPLEASTFRPVAEDAASEAVQSELQWQSKALVRLRQEGVTQEVIRWLRSSTD